MESKSSPSPPPPSSFDCWLLFKEVFIAVSFYIITTGNGFNLHFNASEAGVLFLFFFSYTKVRGNHNTYMHKITTKKNNSLLL